MAAESKVGEEVRKDKYEGAVDAVIAEADALAVSGGYSAAIDAMLAVEKKARLGSDSISTGRVARHIIKIAAQYGSLDTVVEYTMVLSKRRAQLTKAIIGVVQEGMTVLEGLTGDEDRVKLITALRTVSEGKIYVEVERARLTQHLANIRESQGKLTEACDVLQEVQVDTMAEMGTREKAEFLLQQMRLTLAVKDWVRTGIMAGKVSRTVLDGEEFTDLKLVFTSQLIALHTHQEDTWELHKDYEARYGTSTIAEVPAARQEALSYAAIYTAMTEWSDDVSTAMEGFLGNKQLKEELPPCAALLTAFTTPELIQWPLVGEAGRVMAHPLLSSSEAHATLLHRRVVQHNLRVIAACYTRIAFPRLCTLLRLEGPAVEKELSSLVTSGAIFARINRPAGIVAFQAPQAAHEVLGEFGANLREMLSLIETTNHLIQREYMVHGMKA